jgi:hypothetical protein
MDGEGRIEATGDARQGRDSRHRKGSMNGLVARSGLEGIHFLYLPIPNPSEETMTLHRRTRYSFPFALLAAFFLLACGGDGSGPVTAASMSAVGGTSLNGTVGQSVLVEVIVSGSNGKPFAGGVVSFSVTSGGGSASPSSANTDQSGKASTTWTLGTTSGTQGLSASSGGASVQFTAQAAAGLPSSVESVSSFPGEFSPGEPLAQPASFVVRDQFNNAVPGVSVTFTASSGGSANPPQGTTGSDGRVSTTWTLGPVNGTQTLSATISGVNPASVTAEAYDPCLDWKSYSIGQTANGTLTTSSCELTFDNTARFVDYYRFTLANSGAYRFSVSATFQNPFFFLFDPGAVAGEAGDFGEDLVVKAFLDDGGSTKSYFPAVASDEGGVGSYTLSSGNTTSTMQNCDTWVSSKTLSTNQSIGPTDCILTYQGDTYYGDFLTVWLDQGETLVVTESSTFFDTRLWLLYENGPGDYTILWENDDFGGTTNSRLEYTASVSDFYVIAPSSFEAGALGAYSMTISSSGGSGSPPGLQPSGSPPAEVLRIPPASPRSGRVLRVSGPPSMKKR